jgi:hypothetical protein
MNLKDFIRQIILVVVLVTTGFSFSQVNAQSPRVAVTSRGEIISGGPSPAEAQQALQNRINEQSEGRIKLLNFSPTMTKLVKQDAKPHCEFGFEAQIEFSEPCRWASQFNSEPLTFKTFRPDETSVLVRSNDVIQISEKGEGYTAFGSVWFTMGTNGWTLSGFASSENPKLTSELFSERCVLNLRNISAAFALYEIQHDGHNPFNISTNAGGTLELCDRDANGFDKNSALHFQVMSNCLIKTDFLVCPGDSSKQIAKDFQSLTATNVSFLLRSEVNLDNTYQPHQVLVVSPMYGYVLYSDGDIEKKEIK